jgi:hypothetical protein
VVRQGGYHSGEIHVARGVTQGDIPSQEIFNIVVDAVLIYWILEVSGDEKAAIQGGQGWLYVSSVFYSDEGILTSHEDEVLQGSSDVLYKLFERMNLKLNTKKTKSMVFLPGALHEHIATNALYRVFK